MKVLIIGAGNLGNALAVDLLSRNHEVGLWAHPDHPGNTADIGTNGIVAMGEITGHYRPFLYQDLGSAVAGARAIIVTIPSLGGAREDLVEDLALYDLTEKILLWVPGNLASFITPRLETLATLETTTSPYGCRLQDGKAFVKAIKHVVDIASDNDNLPEETREYVESLFPRKLHWCENVMEIALLSTNCVVHPAAVLMNVGRIESTGGDFFFYGEGMTPSVCEMMHSIDKIRVEILARYNFNRLTMIDLANRWYSKIEPDFASFVHNSVPHNATKGAPLDMKHRYLMEDCKMLVFYRDLAKKFNIEAQAIDAVLVMASVVTKEKFEETGFSLKNLGYEELSAADLLEKWGPVSACD